MGEPVEQVDLTVLNVLDPYNFITNTRTGMVLPDEINPLNKLEASIRFTRAAVYDSKSLPEEGKGKRPSLFPEGFWREVWIPDRVCIVLNWLIWSTFATNSMASIIGGT